MQGRGTIQGGGSSFISSSAQFSNRGAVPASSRPATASRSGAQSLAQPTRPVPVVAPPVAAGATVAPRPFVPSLDPDPEAVRAFKESIREKVVASQKANAERGAPTAQYDLGMRYLTGDGVEQDLRLARAWLEAAAIQGNAQAGRKLAALSADPAARLAQSR